MHTHIIYKESSMTNDVNKKVQERYSTVCICKDHEDSRILNICCSAQNSKNYMFKTHTYTHFITMNCSLEL